MENRPDEVNAMETWQENIFCECLVYVSAWKHVSLVELINHSAPKMAK